MRTHIPLELLRRQGHASATARGSPPHSWKPHSRPQSRHMPFHVRFLAFDCDVVSPFEFQWTWVSEEVVFVLGSSWNRACPNQPNQSSLLVPSTMAHMSWQHQSEDGWESHTLLPPHVPASDGEFAPSSNDKNLLGLELSHVPRPVAVV